MEVVPAIGKLSRVHPQTDSPSASVRSGNLRDDTRKHILSESFSLEDTSIRDETNKDPVVAGPSPVSKRARFADSVPGSSLVDMCPADLQVGTTQVYSSLLVSCESVSMDVDECCPGHEKSSMHNNKHEEGYVYPLSRRARSPLTLAFSSHRVHICGRIGGFEAPRVTVDTASDVPRVTFSFVKRHPVLKNEPIHPIPPAVVTLKANGSLIEILGFIRFDLHLGDVARPVEALVISSLRPDI